MKKHYVKKPNWNNTSWYYYIDYHYHRQICTANELRQHSCAKTDRRADRLNYKIRGRRSPAYLDSWNDFNISKNYGKSWKHFTKQKKQWS